MSHWFKPGAHSSSAESALPPTGPDGLADAGQPGPAGGTDEDPGSENAKGATALSKRRQREEALTRLEDGFGRIVQLCDSLQRHFDSQEAQGGRIANSLAEVAGGVSELTSVVRHQGETLQAVVAQLETANARTKRIEDLFGHFSKLTEAQRQTLAIVSQQVDAARQTDERVVESLATSQEAISALGKSCAASTESLKILYQAENHRDQRLGELIQQQSKRFTMMFVVAMILAAVCVASAVVSLVLGAP